MHYSETTRGHAETVGDGPRLRSSQPAYRTGCCTALKQQAAMLEQPEAVLKQPEAAAMLCRPPPAG
ncbi:MAG: hypothetical protein LBD24_03350 [Spirochaetaceae bacterium]|nr:hypothetical protein [Spirochaetaceae bacterium]